MKTRNFSGNYNALYLIFGIALLKLIFHLYLNSSCGFGIFRDEFYYIACSNHLDWGYVDHPPLAILILKFIILIFGNSLFALRLLPVLIGSLTVIITGFIIKKLSGNNFSVLYGCLTVAIAPIYLGFTSIYSMNILDLFFWLMSACIIIKIIIENNSKLFIILGLLFGLGVMNKISMIWMIIGFCVALCFKPYRNWLKNKYLYIGFSICILLIAPFIILNFQNDFAHLEFMRNASGFKYASTNPISLLFEQLMLMTPIFIINMIALILIFKTESFKKYKILIIIFLSTLLILIINWHSKAEYLASAIIIIIPLISLQLGNLSSKLGNYYKNSVLVLFVIFGIILMPLTVPVLSVSETIQYFSRFEFRNSNSENQKLNELPQHYADMFGWEQFAKDVSQIYISLPDSLKSNCLVYAKNYGEAGAIDYYRNKYPLPQVVSRHNNYWLWGFETIKNQKFNSIICINEKEEDMKNSFENYYLGMIHNSEYAMPYENNLKIWVGIGMKIDIYQSWIKEKIYM